MELQNKRGKFIVFEGIDGSGKSTHSKLLVNKLESAGIKVFSTCEPTNDKIGTILRSCLRGEYETDEKAIAGLFMADRIDHITNAANGIIKHLNAGETCVCDRYYFSSFAYNSMHAPMDWVIEINKYAKELLKADLTIYLDILPEDFENRIKNRGTKERYEKLDILKQVRDNYFDAFACFEDENIVVINNSKSKEETAQKIWLEVKPLFNL